MPKTTLEERIQSHAEQIKRLKALQHKQESRERAAKLKQERTSNNRRKILVGALILEEVKENEQRTAELMRKLDIFLVRSEERALFGLPQKAEQGKSKETPQPISA